MSLLTLRITNASTAPAVGGAKGLVVSNQPLTTAKNLTTFIEGLFKGAPSITNAGVPNTCAVRCDVSPVAAVGTFTLSTSSGALDFIINGVTITSTLSGGDTANAAAAAIAINASTDALVAGLITATSAAAGADAIVTITATGSAVGVSGNCITTAASGTGNTADQARLTGGTDGTAQVTAVKASGTFTAASCTGDIVAVINGQSITVTSTGVDATDAALMATAILASEAVGIRGVVTATSALGVVTVTAAQAGTGNVAKTGNGVTTTASGTNFTAGQSVLAGGLEAVSTRFTY